MKIICTCDAEMNKEERLRADGIYRCPNCGEVVEVVRRPMWRTTPVALDQVEDMIRGRAKLSQR
jgi:predicted RNA-binding Zn-ribbon protein involved in translation (DUF1610 family)